MTRFSIYRFIPVILIISVGTSLLTACSKNKSNGPINISTVKSGNEAVSGSSATSIETTNEYTSSEYLTTLARSTAESTKSSEFEKAADEKNIAKSGAGNIIIGVEYASPGMAATYSQLGITGVKYYPEEFKWGNMQCGKCSKIDFKAMDKFVKEYQAAGFSDIVLSLKSQSNWASVNSTTNFAPKPKYIGHYERWISAVVERYDMDGSADMDGLKYPINLVEIGVEFSSFEPEPAEDYINMLEHAYKAAHGASSTVKVLHAAFLASLAFVSDPGTADYEASFAAVDKRIMTHSLADIRKILDRPDIFDVVNFHALSYPGEIEETVEWLEYELSQRNYNKPIVISDTSVNPFSGYGSALVTQGTPSQLSILSPPAKETDRERLKTYFTNLIKKDKASLEWAHAFCATDMVKKVVISAEQGIMAINTAFMEEYAPSKTMLFGAAAGNSIWSGMTLTAVKAFSNERQIKEIRPSFYAIGQLSSHLKGYTAIEKISVADKDIKIYKITNNTGFFFIAWYEPDFLVLPGDNIPVKTAVLEGLGNTAAVEKIISAEGQTVPISTNYNTVNGNLDVNLTYMPCYIIPG